MVSVPETTTPETTTLDVETAQRQLVDYLTALGINAPIVDYPLHRTVEEGKRLRGLMTGTFTKNLLLRDRKRRLFLFAVHEDRVLNLKTVHTHIGANGQLSFAPADQVSTVLGLTPGALTPLALLHDAEGRVTCVLDETLLDAEQVNFHPLVQTKSIGLRPEQVLAFLDACNHKPVILPCDI
jgi:Ala-tRNA(Pro) deacylase